MYAFESVFIIFFNSFTLFIGSCFTKLINFVLYSTIFSKFSTLCAFPYIKPFTESYIISFESEKTKGAK